MSECDRGQVCRVCIFSHSTPLCVYSHTLYLEARQISSKIKQVALICVTFERASSFGPRYYIVRLRSALTFEKFHPSRADLWVHGNSYKSARYQNCLCRMNIRLTFEKVYPMRAYLCRTRRKFSKASPKNISYSESSSEWTFEKLYPNRVYLCRIR